MTDAPNTAKPAKGRPASAKAMAGKKATDQEPIEKQLWKTADAPLSIVGFNPRPAPKCRATCAMSRPKFEAVFQSAPST